LIQDHNTAGQLRPQRQ